MGRLAFAVLGFAALMSACGADLPAEGPAGYVVEASNESGESLVAHKSNIASVQAALEGTFPDLAAYFGNRPKIASSYQDAHDATRGGATFTATWKDRPVRGVVSCTVANGTATVAVIFSRADASKQQWDQLMNPATQPAAATSEPAKQEAGVVLGADSTVYSFPDGTGSITLAPGWTSQTQSATEVIRVVGPAQQAVLINNSIIVNTPDSPAVQMVQRNQAMMRQMSKLNQARGGFAVTVDEIISQQELPAAVQGEKGALIHYRVTRTLNGQSAKYDNLITAQMSMVGNGTWRFTTSGLNGPSEHFEQDKPLMFAMFKSFKLNEEAYTRKMQEQNQQALAQIRQQGEQQAAALRANAEQFQRAQDQRFAVHEQQYAEQKREYAAHNQQWKDQELQKQRSNADFIETIKGTRTVYDTQTGQRADADLSSVNGIVDGLNQAALDPNRYVQIPLRDEMYPVPAGR